ncbi:hypothetical protein JBL43_04840 [Aureibaculum sp. A20]|uniref:IPT/TIG domain-containing protein n=1 Tax=Aureibaculum flavum TaxID=2795986 RepID=A0ABS0WNI5_9FLAO|nr:hypothetical protein [Aureibaculum flavum]MBJ2173551.1 hypothetical protein [Aureibaculum flavum]
MKNINFLKNIISRLFLTLFVALLFSSCENDFIGDEVATQTRPPVITSVSEAREDKPVTQGVLEGTYIIRGENFASLTSIQFNGYSASLKPALGTDKIIFVQIPENAPFVGQENKLTLENPYGTINYDFSLLTITGFTEGTKDGKKVVNLLGGDFSETKSITFVSGTEEQGNLTELPSPNFTVISPSEVEAEVPSGVEQAFIYLETNGGAIAQSDSYGFNYSVYIDGLNPDWSTSEWGGTHDIASTEIALGDFSIKSVREAWSGLTFLPPAGFGYKTYTAITVSIYGTGDAGDSVTLAINDFDGASTAQKLELIPGKWTKYVIPLANFYPSGGAPDNLTRLDFQESSNTGKPNYTFYVDDFGFINQ